MRRDDELDLLPEFLHYRDEGCDLNGSCLDCALPQCVYEQPRGHQRWLTGIRYQEISREFNTGGKGVRELAAAYGVSPRTIQRALKRSKQGENSGKS